MENTKCQNIILSSNNDNNARSRFEMKKNMIEYSGENVHVNFKDSTLHSCRSCWYSVDSVCFR